MNSSQPTDADQIAAFLTSVALRRRRLQLVRSLAAAAAVGGTALAAAAVADRLFVFADGWRWAFAAGVWGVTAGAAWWGGLAAWLRATDVRTIASLSEARLPGLHGRLLAAHQLAGEGDGRDSPTLRAQLRAEVANELRPLHVEVLLPMALVRRALVAAGLVIGAHAVVVAVPGLQWRTLLARVAVPWLDLDRVSSLRISIVEPATPRSVVPAGDPVAVIAELSADPADGAWIDSPDGRIALERRDDGRWAGQLPVADKPVSFRVRAGDGLTAPRLLVPLPRPRASAVTLVITPPAYSKLPVRTLDAGTSGIEALVGSRIDIAVTSDQTLSSAELRLDLDGGPASIALIPAADGRHLGSFTLERSGTSRLRLVAAASGFASTPGGDADVRAVPDLVPTIVLHRPSGELVVPGDELLWLEGEAEDDVGLAEVVLEVRGGVGATGVWRNLTSTMPDHPGAWPVRQRLDLLALGATPGDRIEARLVAIDRKGSRSESAVLAITIATPGFPQSRLDAADALEALAIIGGEVAERTTTAIASGAAWIAVAGDGRQEELAYAADLAAIRRGLDDAGSTARARLPVLRSGTADDVILIGRVARRLADRTVTGNRTESALHAAALASNSRTFADCLAALSAAEAATAAIRDLERLDHDQDDARVLAANAATGDGGERSSRRLLAATVQAGQVGSLLTRVAGRAPASAAVAERLATLLAKARLEDLQTGKAGCFTGAYFGGRTFSERRLVRADPQIRFSNERELAPGLPWQDICIRWTGQVTPPQAGTWTFFTRSDDGVRLWLDDRLLIDNWSDHAPTEDRASVELDGKPVAVRLEYYQGGGGAEIALDWQGADGKRVPLTASSGGETVAIAGFQERLRGVRRDLVPLTTTLLRGASEARRRLAKLAGDEAAELAATDATRDRPAAIAARLEEHAALSEARADADAQTVADRAQAAAAVAALPATADAAATAKAVAALDAGEAAERTVAALEHAAAADDPLAAAEALLHTTPADGALRQAVDKAAEGLLAAADAGREPDQATRDALAAARQIAESERSAARNAVTAARKQLGDAAPALANRLESLAREAAAAAAALPTADPAEAIAEAHNLSDRIEAAQVALHRDANQHDTGDAADRLRARDADGAAALLAQPPPQTEELLRQAAATAEATVRSELLAKAAAQQSALAADLELAARHWRALANQADPEPTRKALRQREAETGVAASLDAAAAERDRLANLAEASREQATASLEAALRQDPAMQRELDNLASAAIEQAHSAAERAAQQEATIAAEARKAGEHRAAQQQAAATANASLHERAKTLAAAVREQAKRSGEQHQARPELEAAATHLDRAAAEPTAAAQAAARAAEELDAAAKRIDAATAPLQDAAAQRAGEAERSAAAHDAAIRAADAAQQAAQAAAENASNQAKTAQAAADQAQQAQAIADAARQAAANANPATATAAQATADAATAAAEAASTAAAKAQTQAAEAATSAEQARNQAATASGQVPSAQTAAAQAAQAKAHADATLAAQPRASEARDSAAQAKALAEASHASAAAAATEAKRRQAEDAALATKQRATADLAADAARAAARAVRHQERLGTAPPALAAEASALAQASQQQAAALAAQLAAGELPAAELSQVAEAMAASAKALASASQPAAAQPDRSAPSAPAPGAPPAAMPGSPASAAPTPGSAARDSAASQAEARALDLLEAGATPAAALAEARQALAQARATARRESRGETPSAIPGAGGSLDRDAGNAVGTAPNPPRQGVDWGRLPKEMARELIQGDREAVPEEYRQQVERYFRAIGERAQEKR